MRYALLIGAMALASISAGYAKPAMVGVYLCTTAERAGVRSIHIEGSGPPKAFADDRAPTRFKVRITPNRNRANPFRIVEIGYDGSDRDPYEWQDENSVLHGSYVGNGGLFHAARGPAFLTLSHADYPNSDGDLEFYHAGFEFPGGEDTQLAVRWGRCRKIG
jgi:hypothetical protein